MRSCIVKMSLIDPIAAERVSWAENGGWKGACESLSILVRGRDFEESKKRMEIVLKTYVRSLFRGHTKAAQKTDFDWLTSPAFDTESRGCGARTTGKRGFSGRRQERIVPVQS
jgi:hypothetical protein